MPWGERYHGTVERTYPVATGEGFEERRSLAVDGCSTRVMHIVMTRVVARGSLRAGQIPILMTQTDADAGVIGHAILAERP